MPKPLPDLAKKLIDANVFVTIATTNDDGSPQATVSWIAREDDVLVFSTIRGRRKTRNLERDPRVSISFFNPDDPYEYIEVRGTAELTEEGGRELIESLSLTYDGVEFKKEPPEIVRVVVRVPAEHVVLHA